MNSAFQSGAELLGDWFGEIESGKKPVRFAVADPFAGLDIRPGRLLMFGAPPGAGKTAAMMQIGTELLRMNPSVRLFVVNVEMAPSLLLERIVSRIAGVKLSKLQDRDLSTNDLYAVRAAVDQMAPFLDRIAFLKAPFTLDAVKDAATAFDANVLIFDYIQRIGVGGNSMDRREQLEGAASEIRRFCDLGAAVLVVSAVSRQRGASGSNYSGLNMASFRGSSELEYGADSAFILEPNAEARQVIFRCEKNRFGSLKDIVTRFDGSTQTFSAPPSGFNGFDEADPAPPLKPERKRKSKGGTTCDA